jgi:5-methylcytosine-specific restriction endonuclease McrA
MDTLVLDVGYRPMLGVKWETAIVWVLEHIVEVVEEYNDRLIRTPSWSVKMPSVVRFLKKIPKKKAIKFSRQNIYLRDKGKCMYCGKKVERDDWEYEHVIPRVQGGKTCWENIVVSCSGPGGCNQRKGGRTPEQAHMFPKVYPVKPRSLPDVASFMPYRRGMPESWRQWLRNEIYWTGELENENS